MTSIHQNISLPDDEILERWRMPHPAFGSGQDRRSSENALLALLYGGLEKAATYAWQNAGRTLIDKTFIRILWTVEELAALGIKPDQIAARLDAFIRRELAPCWEELHELPHEERHRVALALVDMAALELFGSDRNETAASRLLFFLCPQLPIFPFSAGHRQALLSLQPAAPVLGYAGYHQACRELLARNLPSMFPAPPASDAEDAQLRLVINSLLVQGDWWPRRVLAQQLRKQGQLIGLSAEAFAGDERLN